MSLEHEDFIGYIPLHQIPTKHSIYIHTIIPQSLYISPASPAADTFKDTHDPQQAKSKRRHKLKMRQAPPWDARQQKHHRRPSTVFGYD
jgi:hypothetical protein